MSLGGDGLYGGGWRKSRRSIGNGECVEVAPVVQAVAVRDSVDPAGPVLRYSSASWRTFLMDAKLGSFDTPRS
jgi:Domain of unknown function (DUF397)